MHKVLFTYDYKEKLNLIKALGYDVIVKPEKDLVVTKDIEDIDILCCYNPFKTLELNKLKKLKWIQLSSIGVDQAPLDYLNQNNILLTNNRGGYSIPMGEWIVLKILEMLKNSKNLYKQQLEKRWKIDTSILELHGKKVVFVGTGSIALEAAKRLKGFDVELIGVNTSGRNVTFFDRCLPISNLFDALNIADIVVLTVPYTNSTHHLANTEFFNAMKENSYFINVSRGSIVDENSLIDALNYNKFNGVALDVFEHEPLDKNNPLWGFEEVLISPHNSWVSEMRNERRFEAILNNLRAFKNDDEMINVINTKKGY